NAIDETRLYGAEYEVTTRPARRAIIINTSHQVAAWRPLTSKSPKMINGCLAMLPVTKTLQ
ncbi:MAG TPA: hypothetical protein VK602_14935, partial [Phyllobacterium sp.]|nr:hypothetical protein [Phyllobacterium sp.]